ncbi:MAG: rhodanese-like domain-containing protein [Erysipelotrichaceae bacterium]|nr:rhodanese-like domain-containing protein [Erysipelotrichaceae bacterium]MBQ7888879.1 rhodanese-like domain-containing protein [Erysipelotrichaceae bacterium]
MKKLIALLAALLVLAGCSSAPAQKTDEELMAEGWVKNPLENGYVAAPAELPAPVDTTKTYKNAEEKEVACEAGNYSAGCSSINASNLHEYLNRDDVLYIDLRDYADFGGKHLRNFEVIPYFAYIYGDAGQLFSGDVTAPVAAYEESVEIMEVLFPKDATIFLMCQSGGRVAKCIQLLEALGWDTSKIYNVGGMGQFTSDELVAVTSNPAEMKLDATYSFEGLTPVAE